MAKAAGKLQKKYWGAAAVLVIRPMTEIYQQVAALSKRLRPSLVTQILAISNEVTGNERRCRERRFRSMLDLAAEVLAALLLTRRGLSRLPGMSRVGREIQMAGSKWDRHWPMPATLCEAAPLFPSPFCAPVGTFRYDKDVRYHANGFRTAPGFVSQGLKTVVSFTWFLPEPNEPRR
jgi:hypothetical protein